MHHHAAPIFVRGIRGVILVAAVVTLGGCANTFRSTDGARREARRECLSLARASGWSVIDLSSARWLGAGEHEVQLTAERAGTPSHVLRCVYNTGTHFATFPDEPPRGPEGGA